MARRARRSLAKRRREKEKSPSFGGLSFQDCDSGTTRRVRHGDVAAVRVAFDARSGASVLAVTIKEDTDAFAALARACGAAWTGRSPPTGGRWRFRNASTNTPRGTEELRVVWWSYEVRAGSHERGYFQVSGVCITLRTTPFLCSRRRRLRIRPARLGSSVELCSVELLLG